MNPCEKQAFSIDEFAQQFSIGKTKIYQEIKEGRLCAVKSGHRTLITMEAAKEWLSNLPAMSNQGV
jgi:excisionase family DNA binding protein